MRTPHASWQSLRQALPGQSPSGSYLAGFPAGSPSHVAFSDLAQSTILPGKAETLRGRSVLVSTKDHFTAALALIELDGIARRLVLFPPGIESEHRSFVADAAEVDAIVTDADTADSGIPGNALVVRCGSKPEPSSSCDQGTEYPSEWILLTSGTTGRPKLVVHTLASLTGAIGPRVNSTGVVWSTFYDIRRYGGLQIFLRAILGGASLVLPGAREPMTDFLRRAGTSGVSHISGTPSHWRRVLMDPAARKIDPEYIRLSGEIADQAILDHLRAHYPAARISHAFASTEAGVAFEVTDGLAGFPAAMLRDTPDVELKVDGDPLNGGSLKIRSSRTAQHYLEKPPTSLRDADGFIDTGDMLELRGDRYHFAGRRDGAINVGGMKVHPEEVEAVINSHRGVGMSLVHGRRSSFTGAVVVADVVPIAKFGDSGGDRPGLEREILQACREALPRHKVPMIIRFVPSLAVAETGKLVRAHE